jgi:hypothetical protein
MRSAFCSHVELRGLRLTSSGPISRKLPSPTPDAPCDDGRKKKTMIEYIYIYIYAEFSAYRSPLQPEDGRPRLPRRRRPLRALVVPPEQVSLCNDTPTHLTHGTQLRTRKRGEGRLRTWPDFDVTPELRAVRGAQRGGAGVQGAEAEEEEQSEPVHAEAASDGRGCRCGAVNCESPVRVQVCARFK